MTATTTSGVIWTATNHRRYVDQAVDSAASVKRYTGFATCLFTDLDGVAAPELDGVRRCEAHKVKRDQYMLDRLASLPATPFDKTLALDTDTVFMADVSDLFDLLDSFDIVMAHAHCREARHDGAKLDGMCDLPRSFAPVQGGVILYRRNERVWSYLEELIALYKAKQYYDDQVAMRELLYRREDLRFCVLPPEYNFSSEKDIDRWAALDFRDARPKIFHYTRHKGNWRDVVARYEASEGGSNA